MSNQPQKKKRLLLIPSAIRDGWKSLRSRRPSPSSAAQTGPRASVPPSEAAFPLTSRPPTQHNTDIHSLNSPGSADQAGSSTPNQSSFYQGRSPSQSLRQSFNSRLAANYAKTTLSGAYELLKVLKESSDIFLPLKSAVGGVVACVDAYKVSPLLSTIEVDLGLILCTENIWQP